MLQLKSMQSRSRSFFVALVAILGGLTLQTYQLCFLSEGPMSSFLVGLLALSIAPYLVCAVILLGFQRSLPAAVGGCLVLLADMWMHYSVFIHPKGSTAAVGLLFMPIANLVIILPAGLLIGWLVSRFRSKPVN